MPKVITRDDDFKIGAYMFPDRKRPCLCAQHGNEVTIYGTFHSIKAADLFMSELAKLVGAVDDGTINDCSKITNLGNRGG